MIYYLNSYVNPSIINDRDVTVAVNSKIEYMLKVMSNKHDIVNLSFAKSSKHKLKKKEYKVNNISFVFLGTPFPRDPLYFFKYKITILFYLFMNIKEDDSLVVYHALFWIKILKILKKLKKFNLVLELNDFYRYHFNGKESKKIERIEDSFFKIPDAFILANPDMKKKLFVEMEEKPYLVNYGAYNVLQTDKKVNKSIIRVLYSGVAEKLRGAAYLAASSAEYIGEDYELHLACYGTRENLYLLRELIDEINNKRCGAKIIYHGTLDMMNLNKLMSVCDIALSCHSYTDEEKYKAMFSFPSKIPVNMGAGLYMVSPRISTFEGTPFDEATFYFDEFSPKSVASAIIKAGEKIKKGGTKDIPKSIVRKLDVQFKKDFEKIIL